MNGTNEVVIAGAVRTAVGTFGGAFVDTAATQLGATVIKEALARAGIQPDQVDEIIMGNVLSAGLGMNPARQAAIAAGIPDSVPAMTVNKVCGSGLKTVALATQAILLGDADIVVAGGMENMSASPYLLPKGRYGYKMGHGEILDHMIKDGLWRSGGPSRGVVTHQLGRRSVPARPSAKSNRTSAQVSRSPDGGAPGRPVCR